MQEYPLASPETVDIPRFLASCDADLSAWVGTFEEAVDGAEDIRGSYPFVMFEKRLAMARTALRVLTQSCNAALQQHGAQVTLRELSLIVEKEVSAYEGDHRTHVINAFLRLTGEWMGEECVRMTPLFLPGSTRDALVAHVRDAYVSHIEALLRLN